uniref:ABC transmembrane type-1 domain-containing protein n=1 Tax=Timema monikensis TaxID=170555 RepID=A0A7R9DX41_9NEOP|nr:unnamed protein product [Timema monikensis]
MIGTVHKSHEQLYKWMKEFLWTGYKRDLEQSDLYEPLKIDLSENLGDDLERVWEEEQSRALQKGKSPSLLRAIFVTFWKQYIFSGILTFLVSMGSRVAQPLLLGKVIEYFTPNSTMAIEEAYMYGAGMIVNVYLMVIMDHHYNLSAAAVGMRIRIACCSLIYRKVLKLSMVSSGKTTTGWLVNLLSNDVNRFDMVTLFLHFIWIAPLQVLLVTYFLWQYVGVAAFIGVAFIFLQTIPVQSYMSKLTSDLREKIAVIGGGSGMMTPSSRLVADRDDSGSLPLPSRVQVGKVDPGSWILPSRFKIARYDSGSLTLPPSSQSEIDLVRSTSYLRGVYMSFMVFTERTSLFVTLLAYVLLGNTTSSDKVYSMAQFYNVLNLSLAIFYPMALSTGAEAMVSVDRIQEFLMQGEITPRKAIPSTVTQNGMKSCSLGVTIKNGCAKWSPSDSQPTLSDVCFHVKPGALCAIIGPVGSGKFFSRQKRSLFKQDPGLFFQSSLLQAVLGELPLETGSLQVDSDISYASQEPWLFVGSVRQNILFGQPYEKKKYQEVVRVCALERDLQLFPYGDKTIVGERGVSLSGGQRARINLARNMIHPATAQLPPIRTHQTLDLGPSLVFEGVVRDLGIPEPISLN